LLTRNHFEHASHGDVVMMSTNFISRDILNITRMSHNLYLKNAVGFNE